MLHPLSGCQLNRLLVQVQVDGYQWEPYWVGVCSWFGLAWIRKTIWLAWMPASAHKDMHMKKKTVVIMISSKN